MKTFWIQNDQENPMYVGQFNTIEECLFRLNISRATIQVQKKDEYLIIVLENKMDMEQPTPMITREKAISILASVLDGMSTLDLYETEDQEEMRAWIRLEINKLRGL